MLRIQGRKGEVFSFLPIKVADHRNPDAEWKIETRWAPYNCLHYLRQDFDDFCGTIMQILWAFGLL